MTARTDGESGAASQPVDAMHTARRLLSNAGHFACLCRNGKLVTLNLPALRLLNQEETPADDFTGLHFSRLVHKDDAAALASWWAASDDGAASFSALDLGTRRIARIGSATGGWHTLELSCAFHLAGGEQFQIILGRVTENPRPAAAGGDPRGNSRALRRERVKRKWAERSVRRLAYQDHLTGLINRVYFQLRLKNALRHAASSGKTVALMFIDIDRFKDVNDTLGHSVGDQLLKHIAARLKNCVRVTDTVARLGGNEFAVITNHLHQPADMPALAQKILDTFGQPFTLDGHTLHIGACIGATTYPEDAQTPETLQKSADLALHRAKQIGPGRFQTFDPQMNSQLRMRKQLEEELRLAINDNQLVVHYQPKVEITTGKVRGIEALVRWQHPERGMIPPMMFVPLAEASNLILPLTEWVMRAACLDLRHCLDNGLDIGHVSVNLSANLVQHEDLAGLVRRVLEDTGLPARYLELEITESILMEDIEKARIVLNSIYLLGVALSLDDFGTGYSSLTYLRQFPIRTLKIDRSFITGMSQSSEDTAIVRAVIALAHSLNLLVVAEGVEKEKQLNILRHENCDEVQGYYFSKPLPVNELIRWLSARRDSQIKLRAVG